MSKPHLLRMLISERLSAAATEIFGVVERTINDYEEEVLCLHRENARQRELLNVLLKPEIRLNRADPQKLTLGKHLKQQQQQQQQHCTQDRSSGLDQEDPEPSQIKEEQEEFWISQEGEQLPDLTEEEADVPVDSIFDEDQTLFSHLDNSVPTHSTEPDVEHCGVSENKIYFCHVCTRGFSCKGTLKVHVSSHTGAGTAPFGSGVCGEGFGLVRHLNKHIVIHSGERPYNCGVCGKGFKLKQNLKVHMKIHTGERPYSCSACGKGFKLKQHLKGHLRIHTGEKPFKCSVCLKEFGRMGNLKTHMMTHTGERPFSCSVCGKGCYNRSHLKSHMRSHTFKH